MDKVEITMEQINRLKSSYYENKEELREIEDYIDENGVLDNGLCEADESFEAGWNNALEYAFSVLGIKF